MITCKGVKNKNGQTLAQGFQSAISDVTGLQTALDGKVKKINLLNQSAQIDLDAQLSVGDIALIHVLWKGASSTINNLFTSTSGKDINVHPDSIRTKTIASNKNIIFYACAHESDYTIIVMYIDAVPLYTTSDIDGLTAALADKADEADLDDKADKVSSATDGHFAGLDVNGNLTDSGKKATDFANTTHMHTFTDVANNGTTLESTITGIQSTLAGKMDVDSTAHTVVFTDGSESISGLDNETTLCTKMIKVTWTDMLPQITTITDYAQLYVSTTGGTLGATIAQKVIIYKGLKMYKFLRMKLGQAWADWEVKTITFE